MKLTKNFSAEEFACNDGSETPCNVLDNLKLLATELQTLRDHFCLPISINSGYRSPEHNKSVGGASKSQHLLGTAADIVVEGKTPAQVKEAIDQLIAEDKMKNGGLSEYDTFVHYDIREIPARW